MTDLDFCRADGSIPMALNDSKESVLELCLLSSAVSLFAAARSNLRAKNAYLMTQELISSNIKPARSILGWVIIYIYMISNIYMINNRDHDFYFISFIYIYKLYIYIYI